MDTTVQLDEREVEEEEKGEERWRTRREKKRGEAEVLLTIMVLFLNSSMMHDLPTSCPAPLQRQRDQLLTFFSLFSCPGFEHFH